MLQMKISHGQMLVQWFLGLLHPLRLKTMLMRTEVMKKKLLKMWTFTLSLLCLYQRYILSFYE